MPMFKVIEAQEVTRVIIWQHDVEAADEEAALEVAMRGDGDAPTELQPWGDSEFGASGWAVADEDGDVHGDVMQEAVDDIVNNV